MVVISDQLMGLQITNTILQRMLFFKRKAMDHLPYAGLVFWLFFWEGLFWFVVVFFYNFLICGIILISGRNVCMCLEI